ncbi:MAG: hypothetical protein D3913_15275 [Candidatus Electrothrix sp. LOE1_4_5]|nr:hypothetical protein [Candidatus Electrothrix sp. AX1]MCI5119265.1 hypothetical protein [Candidatus Electrothrix gigas]MCI5181504.1 hypothetical protein [Candidatus Electrothrix gigas]
MSTPFMPNQLEDLAQRIDEQLAELQANSSTALHKGNEPDKQEISERLPVQWRAIKEISKEDPQTFWQRFKQAAHNDLCEEGGVLNKQWQKWGDLSNKEVLRTFGAVLAAMGFTGNALEMLVVALSVIVIHIGLKAICDEA